MIDLSQVPEELRLARGDYATVRAAHEDAMKDMQMMCSSLSSYASQILRKMQPDSRVSTEGVDELLDASHDVLKQMVLCAARLESLDEQRQALKLLAWPSKREHWQKEQT